MSHLEFIIAVETDPASLSVEDYVNGMSRLVKTHMWVSLQGSWQRAVIALMDGGILDQYGNVNGEALETLVMETA